MTIRQPIVTVVGQVDHGKTTLLDTIRGTCIAKREAGAITQKISFTEVPSELIKERCDKILKKFNISLEIPGFLFIDTPGHAAFTTLRKRGGALSDLAILIIDINEGIKEQTRESIEILKANKVPFIVALNKVDLISGWRKLSDTLTESIEKQAQFTITDFEKKLYNIMAQLSIYGFDSDLFFRISKFEKQLALIPCSAKTGEGLPELIAMLSGLSQRYLKDKLEIGKEAKGMILEIKKEKGMTNAEAILFDGEMKKTDIIIAATLDKPIELKMRALFEAMPLGQGYKSADKVEASAGLRIQFSGSGEDAIPGMPFIALSEIKKEKLTELENELSQDVQSVIETDTEGIIIKAESLGSLEALIFLLKKSNIPIKKAGIGNINRTDFALAKSNIESEPLNAVILGFNVDEEKEIAEMNAKEKRVKIIGSEVIYHIIENLEKWRKERELEIQRESLKDLTWPAKIKLLPNMCFHDAKPAIFGVKIEAGLLKKGIKLMDENGEEVDHVKEIQSDGKGADKAEMNKEVAISLPNTTYSRQLKQNQKLYSDLKEEEFLKLKENKKYLSPVEILLLQEIAAIKRKTKATWGI